MRNPLLSVLISVDGRTYDSSQFVDRVIEAKQSGGQGYGPTYNDPASVVGPPDWSGSAETGAFDLGEGSGGPCDGYVVAEFVDNRLVNGPGEDLRVFEVGSDREEMVVSIREAGGGWRELGLVDGATVEIDIDPVAELDEEFSQVRLCESPASLGSFGADIDAIAAINSRSVP